MAKYSNPLGMLRTASIFGSKPEQSEADMGGFKPMKRLFGGISPEPKTPWQQVFDVPKFETPEVGNAGPNQPERGDFWDQFKKMNEPGPAMSDYQAALKNQPRYEDYKPSGWRVALASIGGAAGGLNSGAESGAKIAENINQMPYARARQGWSDEIAGKGESAKIESENAQNMSKAYTDYLARSESSRHNRSLEGSSDRNYELELAKFNLPKFETQTSDQGFVQIDPSGRYGPQILGGNPTSLMTARTGERTAATGERNAATNERNAGTNEFSANTGRLNYGLGRDTLNQRGREHEDLQGERSWRQNFDSVKFMQPDPSKEAPATGLTLREMSMFPQWAPFLESDGAGGFKVKADADTSTPMFATFYNEMQKRIQEKQRTFQLPQSLMPRNKIESGGLRIGPSR